ncbi:MAG: hypothetical protein E7295_06955 [Lachnospiraceae bacterium]|nr:hypothetical protein [Lachnospiraceae bacterium]
MNFESIIVLIILVVVTVLFPIVFLLCRDAFRKKFVKTKICAKIQAKKEAKEEARAWESENYYCEKNFYKGYVFKGDFLYGALGGVIGLFTALIIGIKNWPYVHNAWGYYVYDPNYNLTVWYQTLVGIGLGILYGRIANMIPLLTIKIAQNTRISCLKVSSNYQAGKYKEYFAIYRIYIGIIVLLYALTGIAIGLDLWHVASLWDDYSHGLSHIGMLRGFLCRAIFSNLDSEIFDYYMKTHGLVSGFFKCFFILAPLIGAYWGYWIGKLRTTVYTMLIESAKNTKGTYEGIMNKE